MTIRHATVADTAAVLVMAKAFATSPVYAQVLTLSEPHIVTLLATAIENEDALALVAEGRDGMLVGMLVLNVFEHPMSGERVASELVWWVDPSARGGRAAMRMLTFAEGWARDRGAAVLQMIAPSRRVEEFYEATGYTAVERSYQRRL